MAEDSIIQNKAKLKTESQTKKCHLHFYNKQKFTSIGTYRKTKY